MKFFLDTADISEIERLASTGLVDGVTTNPTLIAQAAGGFHGLIKNICSIIPGPVSAEVQAVKFLDMMKQAEALCQIASNVVVKVPLNFEGLKVCSLLAKDNLKVNVTLCFSANQAILAAKAGATYISPFIGRHDDIGYDGLNLIEDIVEIYNNYENFKTEVLVASVRHPIHVLEAAKIGADIVTLPPKILKQLINHPLTEKGIEKFILDWTSTQGMR